MPGSHDNPREESGAHRLAVLLRKSATESVNDERDQVAWRELLSSAHAEDTRSLRRHRFRPWMLAPVAAGLVLVGLVGLRAFSSSPLLFTLDGHEAVRPDVAAEGEQTRALEFSDGSSVRLLSAGRLRVTSTDADGATLSLVRGRVDAEVRHRPSAHWRFELGPYVVQVIGTRFSATWDPEAGEAGLDLIEGAVSVAGPGISSPITVQGGQRFSGNQVGNYNVQSRALTEAAPAVDPAMPPAPAAAAKPRVTIDSARAPSHPSRERPTCAWSGLVSRGQFADIVAAAHAMGVENALATCPAQSLFVLADAARYQGQFEISRDALLAIRRRAPDQAGKAAFFLGRLDEARGNADAALAWYTRALENAQGTFVQEAKAGRARMAKRLSVPSSSP
jgi:hypothetical protein